MAITSLKKRKFKPQKVKTATYDSFRKGLNSLLRDSELSQEQAKALDNLVLDGKGILTQKPGTKNYYQASTNGKIRGLFSSKINDSVELLAISDDGYLTKKSGDSNSIITGASWASGEKVRMMQLQDQAWIVQKDRALTRYDGTNLLSYTTLTSPTSLTATNLSGVTGTFTWSWRVAASSDAGRTLFSDPVVLSGLPEFLTESPVQIGWTSPSAASGLITGFEIAGREQGAESRLTSVPATTTKWIDDGTAIPSQIAQLSDYNETGGPNAKYIIKSVGKVILGRISTAKSRVMWSGADVNIGKFHWTKGGGYIDVGRDDGTEVTGIWESSENKIVVFKERSIYQMELTYNADLGIVEPIVKKISDSIGCLSGDTIQNVENDIYFIGRRPGLGVSLNSLGYQPNILANILRTAEISGAVRPKLQAVNKARFEDMWAIFFDQRYWFFYPVGNSMQALVYDYERGGFSGPLTFPDNPVFGAVHYDSDNIEHFLYGDGDDGYVTEVSKNYNNDKGSDFTWTFVSKKEDFDSPFKLKTLLKSFTHFADLSGSDVSVQILVENDVGLSSTEKSFSVSPTSTLAGWGSFPYGYKIRYGSSAQGSTSTTNTSDVRRFIDLNTPDIVSAQVKIQGTGSQCKIISMELQARDQVSPPSSWQAV